MSDLISRQAVLDELEKWDWQDLYLPIHFKQILDDVPSVENKGEWIPVTEKLPKDHEEVLIYLSSNRITIGLYNSHVLPFAPYKPIGWGVNTKTAVHNFCSDDVVAWMPLPDPYKAEKPETCKGCLEPCIMYEPDMRACKKKVREVSEWRE